MASFEQPRSDESSRNGDQEPVVPFDLEQRLRPILEVFNRACDQLSTSGMSQEQVLVAFLDIVREHSAPESKHEKGVLVAELSSEVLLPLLRITDEERFANKYGQELNSKKLLQLLERFSDCVSVAASLEPIEEIGQNSLFNPVVHESKESLKNNQPILVVARGWKRGEQVLRKAKVSGSRP